MQRLAVTKERSQEVHLRKQLDTEPRGKHVREVRQIAHQEVSESWRRNLKLESSKLTAVLAFGCACLAELTLRRIFDGG